MVRPSGMVATLLDPKSAGKPHYDGIGVAANDTPATTAPPSPNIPPQARRQDSTGEKIARARPTTLDIPGLTKSRVSPDGKISSRDVGSKLVIVMVGLPARGKSYITKKLARYLNWLQHDTRIFNVGERRRVAAGRRTSNAETPMTGSFDKTFRKTPTGAVPTNGVGSHLNGEHAWRTQARAAYYEHNASLENPGAVSDKPPNSESFPELRLPEAHVENDEAVRVEESEGIDQSASFFDPNNKEAALIREQAALDTLDDLLKYILEQGGSVGILDATNSTIQRRKLVMKHIRERAGPDLNVLFMESLCLDEELLERNMRLKLSGPDYRGKDPEASLSDFRKRVAIYQKNYVSLGESEEKANLPYVQMIDVGRKVISHQVKGFLSAQAVYYLLNFNLAPRQIWITRHGQSVDNVSGKIGGDSDLSASGRRYAKALTAFIGAQRNLWDIRQHEKELHTHMPPIPGDHTPPNPHYSAHSEDAAAALGSKSLCVWTSMLKRSIQTADHFDDDDFDIKQMRMLDELFAGHMEGLTYPQIRTQYPSDYDARRRDKLHYRYPGPGGEGYLDVIHRLRPVIVELERMTDHCLLIGHRSVARVLLAYFMGLGRDEVTDLDVPLGVVWCLEPRPYGVDLKAFRYRGEDLGEGEGGQGFEEMMEYELKRSTEERTSEDDKA